MMSRSLRGSFNLFNPGRPFMPSLLRSVLSFAFAASTGLALAQSAPPPNADYKLGPGDAIRVQVYQNPDLTVEARVSESGSINYPLVGGVSVGGLSIGQAETKIAQSLRSSNILKSPQVNIVLLQVRGNQVSVLGQVTKPGRFPLETFNVRVSDMLAAAGGVTPSGDDVLVVSGVRQGKPFRKTVDIPALFAATRSQDDIVLEAGDTIYVNKAPVYYIYGEAQKPGPYRIERGMTVMQALAQGGGTTNRGNQNRLRLHRMATDGSVVQTVPRLTDPVQPNDVLFVRESIF
jgi:polysaccharide biosynthesis/export protein